MATVFPVLALVWASTVASAEVEHRSLEGLAATAKATLLQERQAWDDAVRVVTSASRPSAVRAVTLGDPVVTDRAVQNLLATGPFVDARIYNAVGEQVAMASLPGVTPTMVGPVDGGPPTFGAPTSVGTGAARQVSVPIGVAGLGRLVVDIDLAQLLGRPADLGFGRTGTKFLVASDGLIVAGSAGVGGPLRSPVNLAIAAAGQPVIKQLYSPFFGRMTVESYEPIPEQGLGILVQQARSEVMAGADDLTALLRWAAAGIGILGAALGLSMGMLVGRRSRRLEAAEQRLAPIEAASQLRLEQFLDGVPIGVLVATPDGQPHYANREAERLLGRGVVPLKSVDDLAHTYAAFRAGTSEPYPVAAMPLVRALGGETAHVDDMEIHRPDATVPIEVWGTPVRGADGSVEFGIAAFADVSTRRHGEEAEARLASIVRASNDAILAKTPDGIVTTWNRGAEVLFGYGASEMIGSSIDVLVPAEGREEELELRRRVALGLGVEQYETVRLRQEGTPVDVSVTLSPIEDPGGRITGIATICRDITDRKRAEAALLERKAELAAARDQAIEASRLKSEFLANMSHEIRTPMNAVIGLTGLLLDSPLGAVQREYAGAVRSAGEALLNIINDILDFSKIEAGKLSLEVTDFDPRALVEEVADLLGTRAHQKGLDLLTCVHHDVPHLLQGDPGRLRQVLTNLVGNAVKFTDAGEVVVRVRTTGLAPGPTTLRFEVADTGMGISPQDQRQLFRAFEQVDSSASRRHGGTGLGLVISKQLVEMMDGEIGVDSSLGTGSTFWFSATFLAAAAPPRHVVCRSDLQGLHILVVDGSATNRMILKDQLVSWGMLPTLAESGNEALRTVRAAGDDGKVFDLALLDSNMADMDVLSLATAIRSDPNATAVPLVIMTPGGQHDGRADERSVAVAYLSKPVHEGHLYDSLARASGRSVIDVDPVPAPIPAEQESRPCARLLVAEDNAVNQLVAVRMLQQLGYEADVAANGSEAVDALQRIDYAAVLMDCHMPEMDGYQATQEIRRRQSPTRRTPVIAMTAAATKEDRDRCFEVDMDDYIAKPVRREELQAVLARWIPTGPPPSETDAEIGVPVPTPAAASTA